jgi:hypothetical protein
MRQKILGALQYLDKWGFAGMLSSASSCNRRWLGVSSEFLRHSKNVAGFAVEDG